MTIKTTAGIATLKEREESFKLTIASLYPQVDRIYAVLNNYDEIPEWLSKMPKVIAITGKNNLADSAKFLFVDVVDGYYFSCDDDLVYSWDYCYKMRAAVDKYRCVCTMHGKRFHKRGTTNFRKDYLILMQCLGHTPCDTLLHLGGAGVMAFHTRDFHPTIGGFLRPRMADLWISKQAAEAGVPIMGISHHKGYLKYIPPENPIWDQECDVEFQTGVINKYLAIL